MNSQEFKIIITAKKDTLGYFNISIDREPLVECDRLELMEMLKSVIENLKNL